MPDIVAEVIADGRICPWNVGRSKHLLRDSIDDANPDPVSVGSVGRGDSRSRQSQPHLLKVWGVYTSKNERTKQARKLLPTDEGSLDLPSRGQRK